MLNLLTLPSAQSIVDGSTDYASVWFTQFLPTVYVVVGLAAAVALVWLIRRAIVSGISRFTGHASEEHEGHEIVRSRVDALRWE